MLDRNKQMFIYSILLGIYVVPTGKYLLVFQMILLTYSADPTV